ncbi:BTB/POZ protein, partial [Glomus cerebriforme]
MDPKFLPDLTKNFEQLYETKDGCDLVIYAGEEPNVQKIYAHSVILRCQSKYFYTAFSNNWAEKKDGMYIFNKPNVNPNIMNKIIKFFYCGKLDLDFENAIDVIKLLIAVDEFGLSTLAEYIQEFFVNNQLKVDPVGILKIIFEQQKFLTLQNLSLEKICQEPHILFQKYSFLTLPSYIFENLLSRDDLLLKEIEIWNNVIRWAHAQNPSVNRDPSAWTKDEIKMMEQTTHNFIPFIRFQDINSEDYCTKVMIYKKLLPKKLRAEILQFYLIPSIRRIPGSLPPRLPTIDSVIINHEHIRLFSSWLDKKD